MLPGSCSGAQIALPQHAMPRTTRRILCSAMPVSRRASAANPDARLADPINALTERQMANGGPKRQRLSAQSMAAFDACKLCLSRAKDPRVDLEGHLFCHVRSLNSTVSSAR